MSNTDDVGVGEAARQPGRPAAQKSKHRVLANALLVGGLACFLLSFVVPMLVGGAGGLNRSMTGMQVTLAFSIMGLSVLLIGIAFFVMPKTRRSRGGSPGTGDVPSPGNRTPAPVKGFTRIQNISGTIAAAVGFALILPLILAHGRPGHPLGLGQGLLVILASYVFFALGAYIGSAIEKRKKI